MPTHPLTQHSLCQKQSGNLLFRPRPDHFQSQSQRSEVGVGEVKRVNRMMVVYGFVLEGARLCV